MAADAFEKLADDGLLFAEVETLKEKAPGSGDEEARFCWLAEVR